MNKTTDVNRWTKNQCSTPCYPYPLFFNDSVCGGASGCDTGFGADPWFQFTDTPVHVVDIDGDGKNEFIALPTVEYGASSVNSCGYIAWFRALFMLNGAYGNGGDPTSTATSACYRKTGFDNTLPITGNTLGCQSCQTQAFGVCTCTTGGYYPPRSIPAIAFGDLGLGNSNPEMVFAFDDGRVVCYDYTGTLRWAFDFGADVGISPQVSYIGASESLIVDLNKDGLPEVIFFTYGYPLATLANEWLYILNGQTGAKLWKISYNDASTNPASQFNGNGNGIAGAPTIEDIDGDGTLEILGVTFDGRLIVWNVPGSGTNCQLWRTGRGGYLRKGQPDVYK